jgi:hypothetical protein
MKRVAAQRSMNGRAAWRSCSPVSCRGGALLPRHIVAAQPHIQFGQYDTRTIIELSASSDNSPRFRDTALECCIRPVSIAGSRSVNVPRRLTAARRGYALYPQHIIDQQPHIRFRQVGHVKNGRAEDNLVRVPSCYQHGVEALHPACEDRYREHW